MNITKEICLPLVISWLLLLPSIGFAGTILNGTVLDRSHGRPMSADVLVYEQGDGGEWNYAGSKSTDADGKFKISFLDAGTFILKIAQSTGSCDQMVQYCADRYLPQYYDGVPLWGFQNATKIVLKDGDVRDLAPIRLQIRPFYFETVSNPCEPVDSNGRAQIVRTVVNTTGQPQWMMFWGVVDSPFRADSSRYYGTQASYTFGQAKWELLKPGKNTVNFIHQLGPRAMKGSYYYWIIGGDANGLPMTPYLSGTFCKGVSVTQSVDDWPFSAGAAGGGHAASLVKKIPLRISADGEVLQTGPMAR